MSVAGLSLLNALLTYDPAKRLSARAALRHGYFREQPLPKAPGHMPTFPSAHDSAAPEARQQGWRSRRCAARACHLLWWPHAGFHADQADQYVTFVGAAACQRTAHRL